MSGRADATVTWPEILAGDITQMPAYGFMSQPLPFMIEELIIAVAATNG